jgi:phage terminase large subunit-like protein
VPAENGYPSGDLVRFKPVRAGRGQSKYERAVPVHGFYQQNLRGFRRVFHVGVFKELEGQQTSWIPPENADGSEIFASKWSPDRMDAAVYILLHLLVLEHRRGGRAEGDALRSATIG